MAQNSETDAERMRKLEQSTFTTVEHFEKQVLIFRRASEEFLSMALQNGAEEAYTRTLKEAQELAINLVSTLFETRPEGISTAMVCSTVMYMCSLIASAALASEQCGLLTTILQRASQTALSHGLATVLNEAVEDIANGPRPIN